MWTMTQIVFPDIGPEVDGPFPAIRLKMLPAIPMTQEQLFDFCQQNRDMRIERTAQGDLIIMSLEGGESGARSISIGGQLFVWARRDGTGMCFASSTGFLLPNGANRSPDASWVLRTRLAALSPEQMENFPPLCPDFVVELLSPTDSLRQTEEKMKEYVANGARLGWLINPRKKQVLIYRPKEPTQILENPTTLTGDPVLPGFVLDLGPVWQP
jgi:Uma2 family endonuclease